MLCPSIFHFHVLIAEYSDVSAYRLSLSEDTKAVNQLV